MQTETSSEKSSPAAALDWAFLRRTALATLITSGIVALFASVYFSMAWGARYLVFALWSMAFFSFTALIIKYFVVRANRVMGLLFMAGKLACLGLMVGLLMAWPINESEVRSQGVAMVLGIGTPFMVLVLRVLGWVMEAKRKGQLDAFLTPHRPTPSPGPQPKNTELNSHS